METTYTRIRKFRHLYRLSRLFSVEYIARFVSLILICAMLISMGGCKKAFEYSPNEVRLEEEDLNLNSKNIARIKSQETGDTLKFLLFGDTQRFYDDLADFVVHVNRSEDVNFVLLAGDITDFGLAKEYTWVSRELRKLDIPFVAVPGNHDYLGNGKEVFRQMFGPEDFYFSAGHNFFVCLNTNSIECGFDGSIPDKTFLSSAFEGKDYRNAFVLSHISPQDGDFDKNLVEDYKKWVSKENAVRLSMHGHQHRYIFGTPYNDGVPYLVIGSMQKRNYAHVTVIGDEVKVEERYY